MKTILSIAVIILIVLSSCTTRVESLNADERDARIISVISDSAHNYAKRTNRAPASNISIVKLDSLSSTEYFAYANKNLKKLIEFQRQDVAAGELGVKSASSLLAAYKDDSINYENQNKIYEEAKARRDQSVAELNLMQQKLDSCDKIVRSDPAVFWGYHVVTTFNYKDSGILKRGEAPFLVTREFAVSRF